MPEGQGSGGIQDNQKGGRSPAGDREPQATVPGERENRFRVLRENGDGPTDNAAERALRHCVIDRRVTQVTRGETGERWCERAGTASATGAKQGSPAFAFFREALRAYANGTPAPSLLQNP